MDAVIKTKEYISEGDVMQVVLSQRLSKKFDGDPLRMYEVLRDLNPSPYVFSRYGGFSNNWLLARNLS